MSDSSLVERYLVLGLALGRHVDGFVDAYYGPPALAERVAREAVTPPAGLVREAADLLVDLDAGVGEPDLDAGRRRWLRAQIVGLHTSARKLAGEPIGYADEVEWCYGVRPAPVDTEVFGAAHARLDDALPGSGPLRDRYIAWRESQAVPVDTLPAALHSLADDLRERTDARFGLPEGEHVEWELARDQPWSGFNYYLGGLRSRVAINTDLPVLSPSLAHLVAHEAYPGHHTEHSRKEAGLVRQRGWQEETIFLVGTPQCLLAEGLADLALEVVMGEHPEQEVAAHLRPLGIAYDPEVVAAVAQAGEALNAVRANVAWRLHEEGASVDDAVAYAERWALLPRNRAEKAVEFLTSPTWRAYISCYVEGLPLCRRYVAGDPSRFATLLTEQLVPADLAAAAA
ncbi:hypothetical protein [Rhabdothermincola salaria]|uniref:hypothetical protein n=1 Tax=Rhabdothermincola salaria TaxID=2903142 RepID=UPI001E30007A|nr:hypothetical protein [Rhabdothermincola salaria]MCD9623455.1 hypothetical protein [Rhabdothermincola salaria]